MTDRKEYISKDAALRFCVEVLEDDGLTIEARRVCTDGTKNACSFLYGACARIARDFGYRRIITYILETESGTSLKASGWKMVAHGGVHRGMFRAGGAR